MTRCFANAWPSEPPRFSVFHGILPPRNWGWLRACHCRPAFRSPPSVRRRSRPSSQQPPQHSDAGPPAGGCRAGHSRRLLSQRSKSVMPTVVAAALAASFVAIARRSSAASIFCNRPCPRRTEAFATRNSRSRRNTESPKHSPETNALLSWKSPPEKKPGFAPDDALRSELTIPVPVLLFPSSFQFVPSMTISDPQRHASVGLAPITTKSR